MDLNKPPDKILALSVVGLVVLLWALVWLLGPEAEQMQPDAGADMSMADLLSKPGKKEEEKVVEKPTLGAWGRDPFANPYQAAVEDTKSPPEKTAKPRPRRVQEGPNYKLSAILVTGSSQLVVIDDRTYEVGDQIGEEKISRITLDHIVLTGAYGERMLRVPGPQTKVTVQSAGKK
jgi:hypothetical protein